MVSFRPSKFPVKIITTKKKSLIDANEKAKVFNGEEGVISTIVQNFMQSSFLIFILHIEVYTNPIIYLGRIHSCKEIQHKNMNSWTAMISGYTYNGPHKYQGNAMIA